MKRTPFIVVLVLLALGLLPAAASAANATYAVNVNGDAVDANLAGDPACDSDPATAGPQCTLRAAVEQANSHPGEDEIEFAPVIVGSTIALAGTLTVNETLAIEGCSANPNSPKPCVGVSGGPSFDAIHVEGENVAISGLAITGAKAGISDELVNGLAVKNNWIGLTLAGAVAGNEIGVNIEGGSRSVIGGTEGASGSSPADRNVISGNTDVGVRIFGGEENQVAGNYIGVKSDGTTAAGNGEGIQVFSSTFNLALANLIGGTASAGALATPECDGVCNVIAANSGIGINIGELHSADDLPSTQTKVQGNYVGLGVSGTVARPNGTIAVDAGYAPEFLIGGPQAGDANHITGGTIGIRMAPGEAPFENNFQEARGNFIGLNSAGTAALSPPAEFGIHGISGEFAPLELIENHISMDQGTGIFIEGPGWKVLKNVIGLGVNGEDLPGAHEGMEFVLAGTIGGTPEAIAENTIDNSADAGIALLQGTEDIQVVRNQIGVGAGHGTGGPGILVAGGDVFRPAESNKIGGLTPANANVIDNSAGAGIEVRETQQIKNQILINRGTSDKIFIDLNPSPGRGNDLTNGPNGKIQAPVITAATATGAGGTALPGATVRVYVSESPANQVPTGISEFLGKATADGSGAWSLTYGSAIDPATAVAATQADALGNTSELSGEAAVVGDTTPPVVTITAGPDGLTADPTPTFGFEGDEPGTYHCYVDAATAVACDSLDFTAPPLADGPHTFHVYEVDSAGNQSVVVDRTFTVDTTPPNATVISGPTGTTAETTPTLGYNGEPGGTYHCTLDGVDVTCDGSGKFTPLTPLADGSHVFTVYEEDALGNKGPEDRREFTVAKECPKSETKVTPPPDQVGPGVPPVVLPIADTTPPDTKVKGPKRVVKLKKARFKLFSTEPGSHFQCRLDKKKAWKACRAKFKPKKLKLGKHVFRTRAIDAAGNVDPTPAIVRFRILAKGREKLIKLVRPKHKKRSSAGASASRAATHDAVAAQSCVVEAPPGPPAQGSTSPPITTTPPPADTTPPNTKVKGPKRVLKLKKARFKLFSTEPGSRFQCRLDKKKAWKACRPKFRAKKLKPGKHVLRVRAVDAAGNVDATPAKKRFRVVPPRR